MDESKVLKSLAVVFNRIRSKAKDKRPFTRMEIAILAEFSRISEMSAAKPDPGPQVSGLILAQSLGVSHAAIFNWQKHGGFPEPESDTRWYNVLKICGWLYRSKKKADEKYAAEHGSAAGRPRNPVTPQAQELDAARARKLTADAIRSEMKIAEEEKRLVDRQEILRSLGEHVSTASRQIQDLPHQLAMFVPEAYRARFLEEAQIKTNDLLKYLSEADKINDEKTEEK